jgi:hypothetical protein
VSSDATFTEKNFAVVLGGYTSAHTVSFRRSDRGAIHDQQAKCLMKKTTLSSLSLKIEKQTIDPFLYFIISKMSETA